MKNIVDEMLEISKKTRIPFEEFAFLIQNPNLELRLLSLSIEKRIEDDFDAMRKRESVLDEKTKESHISAMELTYYETLKKIKEDKNIKKVLEIYRSFSCQTKKEGQIAIVKIVELYRKENK